MRETKVMKRVRELMHTRGMKYAQAYAVAMNEQRTANRKKQQRKDSK